MTIDILMVVKWYNAMMKLHKQYLLTISPKEIQCHCETKTGSQLNPISICTYNYTRFELDIVNTFAMKSCKPCFRLCCFQDYPIK